MASRVVASAPTTSTSRTLVSAGRSTTWGERPATIKGTMSTLPSTAVRPRGRTRSDRPSGTWGGPQTTVSAHQVADPEPPGQQPDEQTDAPEPSLPGALPRRVGVDVAAPQHLAGGEAAQLDRRDVPPPVGAHLTRLMIWNIGMYRAITMPPTEKPMKTMRNGSISAVRELTVDSTSRS